MSHSGSALGAAPLLNQTPPHTPGVQLAPEKLKQLFGGLPIHGTKKLPLWCCLSLPLWNATDWAALSKPHTQPWHLPSSGVLPAPTFAHLETDFVKGILFFFFFNLQGTQPQVPLARGYTHSLLNQWKAHQEAPGQCPPSTFLEFAPYALPAGAVLLLPCKAQELKLFLEHQKQKCSGLGLLRVWGFLQLQYGNRMFFLNTDLPMCCCKLRTGSEGETVWTQQQPRPVFL